MTMEDLRLEGRAARLGAVTTTVVTDSPNRKQSRLPTALEIEMAQAAGAKLARALADVPRGLPTEPLAGADAFGLRASAVRHRPVVETVHTAEAAGFGRLRPVIALSLRCAERSLFAGIWRTAIVAYNSMRFHKAADSASAVCTWHHSREIMGHTFARFALPIVWDVSERETREIRHGSCGAETASAEFETHPVQYFAE